MKNTVTLEKLHDILGERIRLLSDTTVPAEVRREELELTQTICTAAKQVVNNADVVLRGEKLMGTASKEGSVFRHILYGTDSKIED